MEEWRELERWINERNLAFGIERIRVRTLLFTRSSSSIAVYINITLFRISAKCVCNLGRRIGRVSAISGKKNIVSNTFSLRKRGKARCFLNLPQMRKMKNFGESSTLTWRPKMLGYFVKTGGLEVERSCYDTKLFSKHCPVRAIYLAQNMSLYDHLGERFSPFVSVASSHLKKDTIFCIFFCWRHLPPQTNRLRATD